eukprot:365390-Chlamydomonas_euryale.AAC.10
MPADEPGVGITGVKSIQSERRCAAAGRIDAANGSKALLATGTGAAAGACARARVRMMRAAMRPLAGSLLPVMRTSAAARLSVCLILPHRWERRCAGCLMAAQTDVSQSCRCRAGPCQRLQTCAPHTCRLAVVPPNTALHAHCRQLGTSPPAWEATCPACMNEPGRAVGVNGRACIHAGVGKHVARAAHGAWGTAMKRAREGGTLQ